MKAAAAVLILAAPFLVGWHPVPTLGTMAEALAVGCAALALLLSPIGTFPSARQYFLGAGGVVVLLLGRTLLEPAVSAPAYTALWLGPAAALAAAALVCYAWQQAWLPVVAAAVLLTAVFNGAIGFLQYWRFEGLLDAFGPYWVYFDRDSVAIGNVAQRNILASLCLMGIAASTYLDWGRPAVMRGVEVFLAYVVALTSSRTPWVILLAVFALTALHHGLAGALRQPSVRRFVLPVLLVLVVALPLNRLLAAWLGLEVPEAALARIQSEGLGLRAVFYSIAVGIATQNAWLGTGWRSTPVVMLEEGYRRHEWGLDDLPTHTHNLFLQLWLENGLPIALVVAAYLAWRALVRPPDTAAGRFAWLAFLVLLVHSQLEFPLWHPGLLLLFCALLRTLESPDTGEVLSHAATPPSMIRVGLAKSASVLLLVGASLTVIQLAAVARAWAWIEHNAYEPGVEERLAAASENPLLEPYVDWVEANHPDNPPSARLRALERVADWTPESGVLARLHHAYAEAGMGQEAGRIRDRLAVVFGIGRRQIEER